MQLQHSAKILTHITLKTQTVAMYDSQHEPDPQKLNSLNNNYNTNSKLLVLYSLTEPDKIRSCDILNLM